MKFPADRKYSEHDEWVREDGGVLVLGISDYAHDALGELVHVELPKVGSTFEAGAELCEVESVKAVASVYCPVKARVTAVNEALDGNEAAINSDPYGEGWLVKLEVLDPSGLDALMDAATYERTVADK